MGKTQLNETTCEEKNIDTSRGTQALASARDFL